MIATMTIVLTQISFCMSQKFYRLLTFLLFSLLRVDQFASTTVSVVNKVSLNVCSLICLSISICMYVRPSTKSCPICISPNRFFDFWYSSSCDLQTLGVLPLAGIFCQLWGVDWQSHTGLIHFLIFSRRLRIFQQHFTPMLHVHICARRQTFIPQFNRVLQKTSQGEIFLAAAVLVDSEVSDWSWRLDEVRPDHPILRADVGRNFLGGGIPGI